MKNPTYVVIMAGGSGTRFWPASTEDKPKQFLDILGTGKTLLQQTVHRFTKLCPVSQVLIVTSKQYLGLVQDQCPDIPFDNILLEPCRRNTAPCIAYASYKIKKRVSEANIIVSPSDHLIRDEQRFLMNVLDGLKFVADRSALLTFGIKPNRPDTGYGYIQSEHGCGGICKVHAFKEKPDFYTASTYLASGNYYWNSGLFLWSLTSILDAYEQYLPEIASVFEHGQHFLDTLEEQHFVDEVFLKSNSISIDCGLMEKASNIFVLKADFDWSDLGTWTSVWEKGTKTKFGNVLPKTQALLYDCTDCIVEVPESKKIVLQGLDGYIVVEANGVLLVCRKDQEQRIKDFREKSLQIEMVESLLL